MRFKLIKLVITIILAGAKTHIHESAYTQQDASTQKVPLFSKRLPYSRGFPLNKKHTLKRAQQVTRTQEKVQQGASHSTTNSHFEGLLYQNCQSYKQ